MTEEVWRYRFKDKASSVHLSSWPKEEEVAEAEKPKFENSYQVATEILSKINSFKTENKKSLKAVVTNLKIEGASKDCEALSSVISYIYDAGNTKQVEILPQKITGASLFDISIELEN